MHDFGVMIAGEDITGAAHIGGELIHEIKRAVDYRGADLLVPEITYDEFICGSLRKLGILEVDPAHPASFGPEPSHEMAPDEATGTADE